MPKLNAEGEFAPFPGVTIVSFPLEKQRSFWDTIYEALNASESIRSHFGLLPPSSYHLTTTNLYTAEHDCEPGGWESFIEENLPFYQSLHRYLNIELNQPIKAYFNPQWEVHEGVLQMFFQLPDEVVENISAFASIYGLNERVPQYFHMTLAYQNSACSSRDVAQAIAEDFKQLVRLVSVHLDDSKVPLAFESPKLCHFKDMTEFTLWDGSFNPFKIEPVQEEATSQKDSVKDGEESLQSDFSAFSRFGR